MTPEISDDIELMIEFIEECCFDESAEELQAARRVEAWLATLRK